MGGYGIMISAGLVLFPTFKDEELREKVRQMLHPEEIKTADAFVSDIRRKSFLHGRIAGKMAIEKIFSDVPSAEIQITTGALGEPYISNLQQPYGVSIAHGDLLNAGLCFPLTFTMGVDVESITERNRAIIPLVLSDSEKEMCSREENELELLHVLWTAKEAAGKAIRLGFRVPHEWYEIDNLETLTFEPRLIHRCRFKHLTMFTALSMAIPGGVMSIAFPTDKETEKLINGLLQQFEGPGATI